MGYSHKTFACPYYLSDGKTSITCTGACIRFHDRQGAMEYIDEFCASVSGWDGCSIARAENSFFDRREGDAKHRKNQAAGKRVR